jgi:hypothetical protein
LENPAQQIRQQAIKESINNKSAVSFKQRQRPSNIHITKVVFKLLPIIINFRKDRCDWVKREGKISTKKNI